jgi:hypothetical protein
LVPRFQVALYASHAAFPVATLKISPYINVTLTFDFDFGLDHPVHGGYVCVRTTLKRKTVIVKQRKLKSGHGHHWGAGTKTNWLTDRRSQFNLNWNLRHCTANYRPVLSSERAPYMKRKKVIVTQRNVTSSHPLQKGHGTKTNWPTDRRSQYNLNLNTLDFSSERAPHKGTTLTVKQ